MLSPVYPGGEGAVKAARGAPAAENTKERMTAMTLGEAKARVRALLDETGENPAGEGRLERFFEMGQREIALYWPPYREQVYGAADARVLPGDCDCPLLIRWPEGRAAAFDPAVGLPAEGVFLLCYRPQIAPILPGAAEDTPLTLDEEANEALLFFVAAQCCAMEEDQRYFQNFYAQYQGRLANLSLYPKGPAGVVEVTEHAAL